MSLCSHRLRLVLILGCAAAIAGCGGVEPDVPEIAATAGDSDTATADDVVSDELIVTTTPGADPDDLDELFSDQGTTVRARLAELSATLLGVEPTRREEVRDALDGSPLVDSVIDNHSIDSEIVPNDTSYPLQWHLDAIEAPAAWEITTGSREILVAVLDSGVDLTHTDLAPNLVSGGNTHDGTSGWQDEFGHGTSIAGVIAAVSDNDEGVASVAWNCRLMPIRVTGEGNKTTSWSLAAGISLAVEAGAKVINISFSPTYDDEILLRQAELARLAGSLVIFSAGNSGEEIIGGGDDAALWVGATGRDESLADFATYGDFVDLVAPGVGIYTTQLGNTYGRSSGSSFAAPVVSGVAALIWSVNPVLRPTTVQGILLATATDLGPVGDDPQYGAGQVNARAALELAEAIVEEQDQTPPAVVISRPTDGASASGSLIVESLVTDDSDLADVVLSIDDTPFAIDHIAPYAFIIDTQKQGFGSHVLSVVATDIAGNSAEDRITVTFADSRDDVAPSIVMESPSDASTVWGVITILAQAIDNQMLDRAEVLIDDQTIDTIPIQRSQATIAYNWSTLTPDSTTGKHTITVRVFDTSGNSDAASVTVTVTQTGLLSSLLRAR